MSIGHLPLYAAAAAARVPAAPRAMALAQITKDSLYEAEKERHWWNTNLIERKSVKNTYIVQNIARQLLELNLSDRPTQQANRALRKHLCTILIKVAREMGVNAPTKVLATVGIKRDSDALYDVLEDAGNLSRRFPKIGQKGTIPQINPGTGIVQRDLTAPRNGDGTYPPLAPREGYVAIRSMTNTQVLMLKSQIAAFEFEVNNLETDELQAVGLDKYTMLEDVRIAKEDIEERETRIAAIEQGLRAKQKRFFQAAKNTNTYPIDGHIAVVADPTNGVLGRHAGREAIGNPLEQMREDLLDDLRVVDGDLYKGTDKNQTISNISEAYNNGTRIKKGKNGLDSFSEPDVALSDLKKTLIPTALALGASIALTAYKDSMGTGAAALIATWGGVPLVATVALCTFAYANYNRGGKLHEWFGED